MLQLPERRVRRFALLALSAFFVVAGANHFVKPDFYLGIMPPYLPAHLELVYVSGFFEILGGTAVLVPSVRGRAGWGLILLLLAIYPANIHMALHPELFPDIPAFVLYA
ncbi:MAG: DoxX family protein [Chloroflexi bacterium]|nr:DoxX family protein [Chloroflexota bacterium]